MSGTVKKDDSGRWFFVVDVPAPIGKRKQVKRRGFQTKKAAEAARDKVLEDLRKGTFVKPVKSTVAQYLATWLDTLETLGRRTTTVEGYRKLHRLYVEQSIGGLELQQLTAMDLDALYATLLRDRGLSARTVRYLHTVIGKALADAERKGLVQRNVARFASPPSASAARAPEVHVWTPQELNAFLAANAKHHHFAVFRVAAMTGLRRGEVCGLRWDDVDVDAGTIVVRNTITTIDHRVVEDTVKTRRSRRVVDVDAETVAVLRTHRTAQIEQRLMVGPGWVDGGYVFTMPDGRPWHPNVISRSFDRRVKHVGLRRIRFHDLRHSHATHLLAAGVNVKVVSDRLGHASTSFTLDVYGHVLPGQQADAAAAAAALVDAV